MPALFFDAYTKIGPRTRCHHAQRWSLQHLLDEMHHCSISGALVTSTRCSQYNLMYENLRLVEELADYDYLFPLWNVMPHWCGDFPEPAELVRQMKQHDIRAVTLNPGAGAWAIEAQTSKPLLKALEDAGTLAILDFTQLPGTPVLEQLAEQYPRLNMLIRNVAWGRAHAIVPVILHHKNVHLSFDFFQINEGLEWFTAQGCIDQIVFCSNTCDMAMGAHRAYVDWADVTDAQRNQIASGNLIRLLGGQKPPREMVNENEDAVMRACRHGQPLPEFTMDMHVHMLHEGMNGTGPAYFMHNGGPSGIRNLARRMGVDKMSTMSWNGPVGVDADNGNKCVIEALDAYPDFYYGLGTFDPIRDSVETQKQKMQELFKDKRFIGLKPYPQYGLPYSHKRYDHWWEFGNERKLYCGLHPFNWYQPGEFESICERFPDLTVVAFHVGGSYDFADTAIDLAKRFKNFMIEITLTPSWLGIVDYLVEHAGADRVMYGSDLPMRDPRQQLGWVVFSRMDYESKKKVLGLNAKKLVDRIVADNADR